PLGALPDGLELGGDVLVDAGEQGRVMPDRAVGLVGLERLGQRLVDAAALLRAGALQHRRAHQRVAEAHGLHLEVDDRRVGGGPEASGGSVAAAGSSAPGSCSGSPDWASGEGYPSRLATSTTMGSDSTRRATNARTSAEGRSRR